MKLELANGTVIENLDQQALESALDGLDHADNSHAILHSEHFIQVATTTGGHLLEYQDATGQYGSADEQISLDRVKDIFRAYLDGDASWKAGVEWTKTEGAGQGATNTGAGAVNPAQDIMGTVKKAATDFAKRKLRKFFKF